MFELLILKLISCFANLFVNVIAMFDLSNSQNDRYSINIL